MTGFLNPSKRLGGSDTIIVPRSSGGIVRAEVALPTISDIPLARAKAVLSQDFSMPENDTTNITGWAADEVVGTDLTVESDGILVNVTGLYEVQSRVEFYDTGSNGVPFRANNMVGHSLDGTLTDADPTTVIDEARYLSNAYGNNGLLMRHSAVARGVAVIEAGQKVFSRAFIDREGSPGNALVNASTSRLMVRRLADVAQLGRRGAPGPAGADGLGVPPGGDTAAYLVKASPADNDTQWVNFPPGGGGLSSSYTYYKHYTTTQTYARGSWQTIKLGTTNNAYPSPTNNTQIHQFQISITNVTGGDPAYVRYQYNQVEEVDKTGPSSAQMWSGGTSDKQHWAHMFEHQGSTVQIEAYMPGSGTFDVDYIIVKCHALAAP